MIRLSLFQSQKYLFNRSHTFQSKSYRQYRNDIKTHYEHHTTLLPQTFIVVRLDGKNYKYLTNYYKFHKPNDQKHINLMNHCAIEIFKKFKKDMLLTYSFSDEINFAFNKESWLFNRDLR
jgi:tRNA(His) 5'-end guanylyltransferase